MTLTATQVANLNNSMSAAQDVGLGTLIKASDDALVTGYGAAKKVTQTVTRAQFTDGGAAVGTFATTTMNIPVGATVLAFALTALTGFIGDTSAVLTIGDGSDVDRYNTGTPSVFTTAANGIALGVASGVKYHDTAVNPVLTLTSASDFTSISAGSMTLVAYYLL